MSRLLAELRTSLVNLLVSCAAWAVWAFISVLTRIAWVLWEMSR